MATASTIPIKRLCQREFAKVATNRSQNSLFIVNLALFLGRFLNDLTQLRDLGIAEVRHFQKIEHGRS